MQREECKHGTEVIIRGKIKRDDGSTTSPIVVEIIGDRHQGSIGFFHPSALEPAHPKYDPAREYRKGDIVRITGFHGRLFGGGYEQKLGGNNKIGDRVELTQDENEGDVRLPSGILEDGYIWLSVACIELVKPIEEIEKEQPYYVEKAGTSFEVWFKGGSGSVLRMHCVSFGDGRAVTQKEARKKAQELCDELNRKHRESLNA